MNPVQARSEATDAGLAKQIAAGTTELDLPVSTAQIDRFVAYIRLIERWNLTYNLTAIRNPSDMVANHVLDCLAAAQAIIQERGPGAGRRLLDVGTGAGLPGLVVAAVSPERDVVCIDSVGKKAAFVRQAAALLELRNVTVLHDRVENVRSTAFDEIVSRAFATLADFVQTTRHLLREEGVWIAMKAKLTANELEPLSVHPYRVQPLHVPGLTAERCLVWISKKASAR